MYTVITERNLYIIMIIHFFLYYRIFDIVSVIVSVIVSLNCDLLTLKIPSFL